MLSIVSIRTVPRYRAYFQQRVKEGKAKMHIIIAVARKLLSVFYAILKKGIPYDPNWEVNRHFAMARHVSNHLSMSPNCRLLNHIKCYRPR